MELIRKISKKVKNAYRLGFSNTWFILKKRWQEKKEYVDLAGLSPKDVQKIMTDSRRRKTGFAVLLCTEGKETVTSAVTQIYDKFHLYEVKDGNWNEAARQCKEDYLVLCPDGVRLHKAALWMFAKKAEETGADLLYCDERQGDLPVYKPDFGIDTFVEQNFLGKVLCIKRETWEKLGGLNQNYATDWLYDIIFRIYESGGRIAHIPQILFSSEAVGFEKIKDPALLQMHRARLDMLPVEDAPLVSILIPNKDHVDVLSRCIDSILAKSTYDAYEILIIENNSTRQATFDYYRKLESDRRIRTITCVTDWNYSYINNYGVREARGEYLLFLNNDTEVITPDWIEQMLCFAKRDDVGAVGVKLLYPDGTIQHGGVTLGVRGVAGHAFHGAPGDARGYMDRLVTTQDLTAVTAACMMVPAAVFSAVGGFDETYRVAFNDTDLCMRIRQRGYLIVFDPHVSLYHYESKSRGQDEESPEKLQRFYGESMQFQKQWCKELEMGDPYYNPHLSLENDNFEFADTDSVGA